MFIFVHFVHSSAIYSKRAQISSKHSWSCLGIVKNALSPTIQNVHYCSFCSFQCNLLKTCPNFVRTLLELPGD